MDLGTTTLPPGTDVISIRSAKEPAQAGVIGYSERGDEYCRITDRPGKTEAQHDAAPVHRLSQWGRLGKGGDRHAPWGGGVAQGSVFGCLPLAAPIGLSPLLILTRMCFGCGTGAPG